MGSRSISEKFERCNCSCGMVTPIPMWRLKNDAPVLSAAEPHLLRDRQLHNPAGSSHRLSYTDATQWHTDRDNWYNESGKFKI